MASGESIPPVFTDYVGRQLLGFLIDQHALGASDATSPPTQEVQT